MTTQRKRRSTAAQGTAGSGQDEYRKSVERSHVPGGFGERNGELRGAVDLAAEAGYAGRKGGPEAPGRGAAGGFRAGNAPANGKGVLRCN